MKKLPITAVLFAFFASVLVTQADTVALKNGVNLTGTIESFDGKVLTLKTDYAGELKLQWSAVTGVTSDMPIFVVTANRTVSGTVTPEGTNLIVRTANAGAVTIPLADVKTIRSQQDQAAYEKSLHPNLIESWKGGVNFGFALARGNSNTTNLNIGFNADRKTMNDDITLYESSVYATTNIPGGGVTANAILGGARYQRNITPQMFAFVSGDFTHDGLQDLNLRSIYTGGLGWHAINTPNTTLDVLAGINYTRETYSAGATSTGLTTGVQRNLPGITFGEAFTHKFGARSTVTEQAYLYPDLSDLSQYRFSLDAAATTKLNSWLGWQISIADRYVTNPPILGTKPNDTIFSTGLTVSFAH